MQFFTDIIVQLWYQAKAAVDDKKYSAVICAKVMSLQQHPHSLLALFQ